jgi:hypothetical protein
VKLRDWNIVVTERFEEKCSLRTIHIVTPCNRSITFFLFMLVGIRNCLLLSTLVFHHIAHTSSPERNKCIESF